MTDAIMDVAARCGVDEGVVRRVLCSRLEDLHPDIVAAVLRAAREMGLTGLRRKGRLGILYAEESGRGLTHPFFSPILNAIWEEAAAHAYDINFISRHGGELGPCDDLDGLLMVCVNYAAPEIRELAASGVPCVTIDHIYRRVPAVLSDNETGVQKLVEYAISRGHRRIAFIHGHNNSVVTRARIQQFYNTMEYYGLPVPEGFVLEGRYDNIGLTRELTLRLLRLPQRPTCVLLPDDMSYLGAQEAARELEMDIPGDISFVGYDGVALIQKLNPRLTTIRQDTESMGRTAARLLIDLIEHPESAKHKPLVLPVEFMPGGTVAQLPAES